MIHVIQITIKGTEQPITDWCEDIWWALIKQDQKMNGVNSETKFFVFPEVPSYDEIYRSVTQGTLEVINED